MTQSSSSTVRKTEQARYLAGETRPVSGKARNDIFELTRTYRPEREGSESVAAQNERTWTKVFP